MIPPKTASLSNLIDNGSLVPECSNLDNTSDMPKTGIIAEQALQTTQTQKVRPPLAPKPKISPDKKELFRKKSTSILRDRSMSVCEVRSPHSWDLKPPLRQRISVHTPPPKPPRSSVYETEEMTISNSSFPHQSEATKQTHRFDWQQRHAALPEQLDEEHDLTPVHPKSDPEVSFAQESLSHKPAIQAMSYPMVLGHPSKQHLQIDPDFVPQWGPNERETIEHYHDLQAKHLPLFKSMTLTELARKYAKFFPLKVQVTEGHYGMSSKYSISTDDRLNVHFKKRIKAVMIQTYGEEYFIPLSSAIQFGLVYDPGDNQAEAMDGHRFRRVADLISTQRLPKIVRVKSACSCSNGVFLEHNELVVIKKVRKSLFRGKPMLKVFSLLTMTNKLLPEEAIGDFTTKPLCLKLDLPQFLEHIPKPFPSKVMMYLDKDEEGASNAEEEELPPYMFSWPVTLKEMKKHKSLVATPEKSLQLIDLPLHGNIATVKANIVPPNSPDDIQELFVNTQTFLRQFDVTQVDIYGDFHTESAYDTQNTLYKIVRESAKSLGVKVVTPESLKKLQVHLQCHKHVQLEGDNDEADDADSFTSSNGEDHVYATLPWSVDSDEEYEVLQQVQIRPMVNTEAVPDLLDNQPVTINRNIPIPIPRKVPVPRMRSDISLSGSGVFRFIQRGSNLTPPNEPLTNTHRSVSLGQLTNTEMSAQELEENRQYLKTFSITQVSLINSTQILPLHHCATCCPHIIGFSPARCHESGQVQKNVQGAARIRRSAC